MFWWRLYRAWVGWMQIQHGSLQQLLWKAFRKVWYIRSRKESGRCLPFKMYAMSNKRYVYKRHNRDACNVLGVWAAGIYRKYGDGRMGVDIVHIRSLARREGIRALVVATPRGQVNM
jgi:hypothetical protein